MRLCKLFATLTYIHVVMNALCQESVKNRRKPFASYMYMYSQTVLHSTVLLVTKPLPAHACSNSQFM